MRFARKAIAYFCLTLTVLSLAQGDVTWALIWFGMPAAAQAYLR